jgi:hypothetical protein
MQPFSSKKPPLLRLVRGGPHMDSSTRNTRS